MILFWTIFIGGIVLFRETTARADYTDDSCITFSASLYDYGIWTNGDINTKTGKSYGSDSGYMNHCRTKLAPLTEIVIGPRDENTIVTILYYNRENTSSYLGCISYDKPDAPIDTMEGLNRFPTAKYIRFLVQRSDNKRIDDVEALLKKIHVSMDVRDMYIHERPQSKGIMNMRQRAYDLVNITYTLSSDLPAQEGNTFADKLIPEGTVCKGIKYSSTREEQLFIPQAVSLETFASAVLNPNSYLYTRRSDSPNSLTYYGAVCSTFVAYCYAIDDVIPTTISFSTYDGFEPLPDDLQNPYAAKIGYMLNKGGSHIAIVTDVVEDVNGSIIAIELSEASHPYMVRRWFTPQEIQESRFQNGYVMYDYRYVDKIPAENNEDYLSINCLLYSDGKINAYLAPRRGDKANWRYGEEVEIDVIDPAGFTSYTLCDADSGAVMSKKPIPGSLISLTRLSAGRYCLYLDDGEHYSPPVYFNVVCTEETYTVRGESVKVAFNASIGTPTAVLFLNNNSGCSDYKAVRAFHVLTSEEIESGYCILSKPKSSELEFNDEEYEAPNSVWKMRVMYKTEYGIYSGDISDVPF